MTRPDAATEALVEAMAEVQGLGPLFREYKRSVSSWRPASYRRVQGEGEN